MVRKNDEGKGFIILSTNITRYSTLLYGQVSRFYRSNVENNRYKISRSTNSHVVLRQKQAQVDAQWMDG